MLFALRHRCFGIGANDAVWMTTCLMFGCAAGRVRVQGKEGGLTIHDYNYNAFDQEPRPYSYGV